jgi:hypothetical protein
VHQGTMQSSCSTCHNSTSFRDVDGLFVHALTSFPLTGAHEQTVCESCHVDDAGGAFSALDPACETCHANEYLAATTLDHNSLGFATACENCHSTVTWSSGVFASHGDVSRGFDLVGAHEVARCESCHVVPGFASLFTATDEEDCYACHAADYDREHQGSGFPTTCSTCHGSDSWENGDFRDHDRELFPIYSGAHRGEWQSCQTCHITPTDFQVFTCLSCHEHSQSRMDDKHSGRSGYVYESVACLNCHPRGRE